MNSLKLFLKYVLNPYFSLSDCSVLEYGLGGDDVSSQGQKFARAKA